VGNTPLHHYACSNIFWINRTHYFIAVESLRKQLYDAVKVSTSEDNFHVPLQVVQYKESDGEVFGTTFDMSQKNETQSQTSVHYDAKNLFFEAEKQQSIFVGVVGEPGVGKTSLIESILTHLTTDNCPLIFFISIRSTDFECALTTFQLLVKEFLPEWKTDKNTEDGLIKKISELPDVYILVDGLDEAESGHFSSLSKTINLCETATADRIIQNIFEGRVLKNAKKLVTSRPDAFLSLHPKCKPAFKVQILGIGEESQKMLSLQLCDNNAEESAKVQAKLEMNPDLSALCYIPLYCKIIVEQLRFSSESASLTHVTSTYIFIQALYEYITSEAEYLRGDRDGLLKVMELALNGIANNKFIFTFNKIPEGERQVFTNFLKVKTRGSSKCRGKILDGRKQFFFVHLLWQELFAAMKLMLFSDDVQFENYLEKMHHLEWKSVLHFVYGLTNDASQELLADLFSFQSEVLDAKIQLLTAYVKKSVVSDGEVDPSNKLVVPCSRAFEADQESITEEVIRLFPEILELPDNMKPKEAVAISYVLSYKNSSQRKITIGMKDPKTFRGNSLKLLLDAANGNGHKVSDIMSHVAIAVA